MKTLFFATLFSASIAPSVRAQELYSEGGLTLRYTASLYNSVVLEKVLYDQYEVKVTFTNGSADYIHQPLSCGVLFHPAAKHPTSASEVDFAMAGSVKGYLEYKDGIPLPADLDSPCESHKYGLVMARWIIRPGTTDECTKYILVKAGEELPKPSYGIKFSNEYPSVVNGTHEIIEMWIDREEHGISLNKARLWPLHFPPHYRDEARCGTAKPLGEEGDVAALFKSDGTPVPGGFSAEEQALILRYRSAATEARRMDMDVPDSLLQLPLFDKQKTWRAVVQSRADMLDVLARYERTAADNRERQRAEEERARLVAEAERQRAEAERQQIAYEERERARQAYEAEQQRVAAEERRRQWAYEQEAREAERKRKSMEDFNQALKGLNNAVQQYQQNRQQNSTRSKSEPYRCESCPAGTQR